MTSFAQELHEILKTAAPFIPPAARQQMHRATYTPISKGKSSKTMEARMEGVGTEEGQEAIKQEGKAV